MYELGPRFDELAVEPGTNLLVTGPPLTGKRQLAMEILATGARNGDGTIIVSARDSARRVRAELPAAMGTGPVGIVDAVTQHLGQTIEDDEQTKYTSSPQNITAIGVKFSELIQSFYTERTIEQNRVLVDSLTTLLLYANLQTVFRFTHVFTSRIESVNAVGLYTIESTAHDEETLNTMAQLFDGTIAVDKSGTATVTLPSGETTLDSVGSV